MTSSISSYIIEKIWKGNEESQCIQLMTRKMFLYTIQLYAIQWRVKMSHTVSQPVALRALDSYPRNFLKSVFFCLITFILFVPPCLCESNSSSKSDSDSSKLFDFQEKLESRILNWFFFAARLDFSLVFYWNALYSVHSGKYRYERSIIWHFYV